MMIEKLFASFKQYLPLNQQEKLDLSKRVTERNIKKRQFILAENDVCRNYSFVAEGCFKKYYIDKKKTEHNLQFIMEGEWIMEIDSFYNEKPSRVYIEALENSVIYQIGKNDLLHLFVKNPKFDRNFRVFSEKRILELETRVLNALSSSAEERYLAFLKQYPELPCHISNVQIASYLGITPEFFSRLRKLIGSRPEFV